MYINNMGIIKMFRGDSFSVVPFINNSTEMIDDKYEITANDTIYFGLMECNQRFEDAILKKVYTIADIKNDLTFHYRWWKNYWLTW